MTKLLQFAVPVDTWKNWKENNPKITKKTNQHFFTSEKGSARFSPCAFLSIPANSVSIQFVVSEHIFLKVAVLLFQFFKGGINVAIGGEVVKSGGAFLRLRFGDRFEAVGAETMGIDFFISNGIVLAFGHVVQRAGFQLLLVVGVQQLIQTAHADAVAVGLQLNGRDHRGDGL